MQSESEKDAVAAALRVQLQNELQNIKQCAYQSYECTQLTIEGYKYCLRHILQDKRAPYKQCSHIYTSNGKNCHLPAPRDKKDSGYCTEHASKFYLNSSKPNNRSQPPRTAEVLLNYVSHYIKEKSPKSNNSSNTQHLNDNYSTIPDELNSIVTKSVDPFVDIDANKVLATSNEVLDMCSESESDIEPSAYGSVWHDTNAESSDNNSIDSEQEDLLKHSNIYSSEEVTLITRDKLKRLQSLYIEQYNYLQQMLKEHKRHYLFALKHEKETCGNIYGQLCENAKEQRLYKKLKAYNRYHKTYGAEAVCVKRLHERRLKAIEGFTSKQPNYMKCIFTEGGVKCGERTLPVTRHCPKHILEDPNQILFRACGKMCGDIECLTPVETIFDDAMCHLHTDFPPVRVYNQLRKDSESDYEEAIKPASFESESNRVKVERLYTEALFPNLNFDSDMLKLESHCEDADIDISDPQDFEANISTMMSFVETSSNNIEELKNNVEMPIDHTKHVETATENNVYSEDDMEKESLKISL